MMAFAVNNWIECETLRSSQNLGSILANCLNKDFDYQNYNRQRVPNRSLKGVENLPVIYIFHQSFQTIQLILVTHAVIQK